MKKFSGLVLWVVCLALFFLRSWRPRGLMSCPIRRFMDRAARFFSFRDPSLRNALAGSMLLGSAAV